MRSFAEFAAAILVLATAAGTVILAQSSQSKTLYEEALARESSLRREMGGARTDATQSSVLTRVRALVGAYEDMSRLFPTSGYSDNALWQGGVLAADAFWQFGDAVDRTRALRLLTALRSRFPTSSLASKVSSHTKRLEGARATATSTPPRAPTPAPAPTALSGLPAALTGITREVLPEVLRIVIQLGKEVAFYDERIDGPPRVFLDLQNTRAVEALKDAVIPFSDDVVKQVRVGRQPNSRTRVVLDMQAEARYSVYTLYEPYRIVVDFERKRAIAPTTASAVAPTRGSVPPTTDSSVAPTSDSSITPTSAGAIAPTSVSPVAPTPESAIAPTSAGAIAPLAPAPASPSTNMNGGFSLSRQLGLGVARIVIDAGHGGHDPGAKARGLTEADLVLDVALRLERLLKEAGVEVLMTRRTDAFVPLEQRTAIANRAEADLFLSIHSNASTNDTARGVETYFLNFAPNPAAEAIAARENAGGAKTMRNLPDIVRAIALNNKIDESRDFASMVQQSLYTRLLKTNKSVRNLGVKQAPFMVLVGATMPSILAEISFITNRQEAALLKTDKYKQQIAEALLAGVIRYQQALKKAPAVAARQP